MICNLHSLKLEPYVAKPEDTLDMLNFSADPFIKMIMDSITYCTQQMMQVYMIPSQYLQSNTDSIYREEQARKRQDMLDKWF